MSDAVIYVSITDGNKTLTLDGNLCLFSNLLLALQGKASELHQVLPAPTGNQVQDQTNKETNRVES